MAARTDRRYDRERTTSAVGVAAVHAVLGYALLLGLDVDIVRDADNAPTMLNLPRELPPPVLDEPEPDPQPTREEGGAAAPPALAARPTPVVALASPTPRTSPIATPVAAIGEDAAAGAAPVLGPGTGAGGEGAGTGSGSAGEGAGGGGGGVTRARHVAGRIHDADYPRGAGDAGAQGTVVVHYDIGIDGRASRCRVVDGSGNDELDATTCRIIERRFRYEPARDEAGRAVPDVTGWKEVWWIGARRPRMVGEVWDGMIVDVPGS